MSHNRTLQIEALQSFKKPDPEFLKEDPKLISDTLLVAIQDAAKQAKNFNDAEMQKVTSAFQMPGMF